MGGMPTPALQWQLNGEDIAGETGSVFSLHHVYADTSGTYTCRASNKVDSKLSAPMYVSIKDQV